MRVPARAVLVMGGFLFGATSVLVRERAVAANGVVVNAHTIHREVIPSFTRQTGLACNICHTTFPQLTPFGRLFKLNGYTLTGLQVIEAGDTAKRSLRLDLVPPVSAMVMSSVTRTKSAQPGTQNGNAELPQQMSVFLGEEISPRMGTFLQFTYSGPSGSFGIDNLDLRYANHTRVLGKNTIWGLSLNNNPTVQDVWNSTPAWGFPWASSPVAPTPAAAPLVAGALAQQVAGFGGYALWNNRVYGELSGYRSAPQGGPHPPDSSATNTLRHVAPYWRVAVQQSWRGQYLELGTFGLATTLFPTGVSGATNRYTDVAFDGQYERRIGGGNVTAHAAWIHERQNLDAFFATGAAANRANTLRTFRVDGSYYTAGRVGTTLAYFTTSGDRDTLLYAPGPVTGSRTGSPNSSGLIGELDFLPWLNTRLVLQYVAYTKFNGATSGYDGSGRNASDNNTFYVLAWLVF
jgi:hypothetical protein